jgi:hypothetical protein
MASTERETAQAQIDARMKQFGETINTLRMKAEKRGGRIDPQVVRTLEAIEGQQDQVDRKVQAMADLDDDEWTAAKNAIDAHFDDIDAGLRQALAHFR